MNISKFTIKLQELLHDAKSFAEERKHQEINIEHFAYTLLSKSNITISIMKKIGADINLMKEKILKELDYLPKVSGNLSDTYLSTSLKGVLEDGFKVMIDLKDKFLSEEHVLVALAESDYRVISRIFTEEGISKERILTAISMIRGSFTIDNQNPDGTYDALERYTKNITDLARRDKLDPVIGRDEEIRRIITILGRRTKNNPVLIGDAGVGKTAIVEGLALRIQKGDIPGNLADKELLMLDLGALVAGTKYRGEFEERLNTILKEITNNQDKYVLFIDELHTLVGAGAAEGSLDASNILKPALARGELRCIGATTINEYRKYIEKDSALTRRFQPVLVSEPNVVESIKILRGLKERYETYHGVKISDEALIASVKLSNRYINDRFLPDKAIDLIDEAASRLRSELDSMPLELDEIKRQIIQLQIEANSLKKEKSKDSKENLEKINNEIEHLNNEFKILENQWKNEKEIINKISTINKQIEQTKIDEEKATREGNLEKASEIKYSTRFNLMKELKELESKLEEIQKRKKLLTQEVDEEDIAKIVAQWTNIPLSRLIESEREKLLKMEENLKNHIIGQDQALSVISNAIRRGRSGIQDKDRPIGSFIFMGPTGVGKTETAKALAEFLFDTRKAMIRIDMSEFMEKHSVARLIGAPPGYVGYDEGGYLTEAIRRRPYAVILFDEIEKAHPDVHNILLQILDDGRLTDGKGKTVDFKNTVLIMTSNVASHLILENQGSMDDKTIEQAKDALKNYFRPEFLNRLDEVIVFNFLSKEEMVEILEIQIRELNKTLTDKKISISLTEKAKKQIIELGYDQNLGARPLKRAIQKHILDSMAIKILSGEIKMGDNVEVSVDSNHNFTLASMNSKKSKLNGGRAY